MTATPAALTDVISREDQPHLVAMFASIGAGYRFIYVCHDGAPLDVLDVAAALTTDTDDIAMIYALRPRRAVVDTYRTYDRRTAVGERYRADEYQQRGAHPLWVRRGSVATVVAELLSLPDDDQRGSPRRARARGELWLPGQSLS
ncbi:hypothetical protein ACFS2C_13600 [Prauserella oleivorans]|uniref:Uncharacterized protein n=1 Tax=Prauserella oleivorans TaxID=1478153 RepID=A0ABW5W941_9PSEU